MRGATPSASSTSSARGEHELATERMRRAEFLATAVPGVLSPRGGGATDGSGGGGGTSAASSQAVVITATGVAADPARLRGRTRRGPGVIPATTLPGAKPDVYRSTLEYFDLQTRSRLVGKFLESRAKLEWVRRGEAWGCCFSVCCC
jgi:hypothetical protein